MKLINNARRKIENKNLLRVNDSFLVSDKSKQNSLIFFLLSLRYGNLEKVIKKTKDPKDAS